jgi:hypothetical protein
MYHPIRKLLMRFLGVVGFHRKFCPNLSGIIAPLTNLLRKGVKYKFDDCCKEAFEKTKALLSLKPVLQVPDYQRLG